VFPGNQISVTRTPEFATAARVSLIARGEAANSDGREWSLAWRTALYARLHDGENAHRMVKLLLSNRNTYINLFGRHPPMQMDGNFGITAGMCEMLLQSQAGEIELVPALPKAWPTGKFSGLRAPGGFVVDCQWRDGEVVSYRVAAPEPRQVKVRSSGQVKTITAEKL
jgi:alpha-L-fucosidase 2